MVLIPITCPECNSEDIGKYGKCANKKQRYICRNADCSRKTFVLEYTYNAYDPNVRASVYEHTVNGNGTLATSRLLKISKNTVTSLLKKRKS